MYAPLKVTTDYSLLKSLIKIENLIPFLKENNIKCCSICDENLYGVLSFYKECRKNDIKPIVGLSIVLNDLPVYLYAKNYAGYKNLLKIHTIMQKDSINILDLKNYANDIAVIIPYKSNSLYETLCFYEDLYIGYQNDYEKNNARIISDHIVFVNDLRALEVNDLKYLEYLDKLRKEKTKDYAYNYYLKNVTGEEDNINEFINLCNLEIPDNKRYIPKYNCATDSYVFLASLAHRGLEKRLNGKVSEAYAKRLEYELSVIKNMGFVDYFLIVYDYVLYAKKNNILVGPGRGSAAGSLVCYAIGITDIDPLKYNLMFERFLNPGRITMPDIDIDFDAAKREDVINYVKNKYGKLNVAPGITFNSLKSKLVLKEVSKLLNIDNILVDKFTKEINGSVSLKENLQLPNVKIYLNNYSKLKELYKVSLKLEGIKRNISTHAAGVVISNVPLDEIIPVYISDNLYLTGVEMEYLEEMGLLKMDFLGLKNLTTIANVIERIGHNVLSKISLDEEVVYNLFKTGRTEGIFQFETLSMRSLLLKLKPSCFNDLVAAVALGRPGPKDYADSFSRRKNKKERITYLHPDLEPILKETYGILLYQEQIIAILGKIGGYTYSEADLIRRAISKKKESIILEKRTDFISRAIKLNYDEKIATAIYDQISKFASYGFNKSHSVAYSLIAYQMAYLKVHYPVYFITELMSDGNFKNTEYISYLKQKKIVFLKPSVNNNRIDYEIIGNKLIMPLKMIKGIGEDLSLKILNNKKDKYEDLFDLVLKTKEFMTENLLKILIDAGAMDCFGLNHQTLINNIDSALNYASLADIDSSLVKKPAIIEYPEYNEDILREQERNAYGFFISNHPASKYISPKIMKLKEIDKNLFKKVTVVCLIDNIKMVKTKHQEPMAFFTASDETSSVEFTVFPTEYEDFKNSKVGELLEIKGTVSKRFDKMQIIVNNIRKLEG